MAKRTQDKINGKAKDRFRISPKSLASLGIAFPLSWAFLINAASYTGEATGFNSQAPWSIAYAVLAAAMLAFGFATSKVPWLSSHRGVDGLMSALGGVGTIVMTLAFNTHALSFLQLPSTILCSCVLGWLYLQWSAAYVTLSTRQAVGCLFFANIAASLVKCVVHFLPLYAATLITCLLPVVSMLLCRIAVAEEEPSTAPIVRFESHNMRGLWKVGVAVIVFSFVTALLLGRFAGNQSALVTSAFLAARGVEVVISIIVLALVMYAGKSFNFSQLWRILLIVLAVDMLCQAAIPQYTIIRCVESSAWDLLVLFSWLTFADIARHATIPAPLVFGVGWACYTAPFATGTAIAALAPLGSMSVATTVALMFALLLTSAFCLELRDQDTKWIFAELSGEPTVEPANYRDVDQKCADLGTQYGLTPRELEIMQLLCKGRTKAYIAEKLYLTENTVKSHVKHIYAKLDVHSKQELLNLVE